MKNLLITESCFMVGKGHIQDGTILENVEESLALELISSGRAVYTNEELVVREPEIVNRDPKVKKK